MHIYFLMISSLLLNSTMHASEASEVELKIVLDKPRVTLNNSPAVYSCLTNEWPSNLATKATRLEALESEIVQHECTLTSLKLQAIDRPTQTLAVYKLLRRIPENNLITSLQAIRSAAITIHTMKKEKKSPQEIHTAQHALSESFVLQHIEPYANQEPRILPEEAMSDLLAQELFLRHIRLMHTQYIQESKAEKS